MANKSRNRLNQPPTGEGKKQSPRSGQANKLHKRAEVLQARRRSRILAARKKRKSGRQASKTVFVSWRTTSRASP